VLKLLLAPNDEHSLTIESPPAGQNNEKMQTVTKAALAISVLPLVYIFSCAFLMSYRPLNTIYKTLGSIMKTTGTLLLLIFISACSMVGGNKAADKREWIPVSCIGFADWQVCQDKAKRLCPGGYDSRNHQESLITQNRSMEVACKSQ
jgi:hypothetical protein